jgi:hypothetical protein
MNSVHLKINTDLIKHYTLETVLVLVLRLKARLTPTQLGPIAKATFNH